MDSCYSQYCLFSYVHKPQYIAVRVNYIKLFPVGHLTQVLNNLNVPRQYIFIITFYVSHAEVYIQVFIFPPSFSFFLGGTACFKWMECPLQPIPA